MKTKPINVTWNPAGKCYLGTKIVGGVHHAEVLGAITPTSEWVATCALPGMKSPLGTEETEEEAKALLLKAIAIWLFRTGLTQEVEGDCEKN